MRWFASIVMLVISLCACNSPISAESGDAPYACIPPARPAAKTAIQPRVSVIGDSYTGGSPQGGNGDRRWTSLVNAQLRSRGIEAAVKVGAEGGAGYVAGGRRTGEVFADKIQAAVRSGDKVVVAFGSINDAKAPGGKLARATCDTLRSIEITAPAAHLLVISPPWVNSEPPPEILQARDILRVRAKELGATFIDPIADGWFVDRPDLIGADGVHPTDEGHEYMAQKIGPVIERLLAEPLTR